MGYISTLVSADPMDIAPGGAGIPLSVLNAAKKALLSPSDRAVMEAADSLKRGLEDQLRGTSDPVLQAQLRAMITQVNTAISNGPAAVAQLGNVQVASFTVANVDSAQDAGLTTERVTLALNTEQAREQATRDFTSDMYARDPEMREFMKTEFAQKGLAEANKADPSVVQAVQGLQALETAAPGLKEDIAQSQKLSFASLADIKKINEEPKAGDHDIDVNGNPVAKDDTTILRMDKYKTDLNDAAKRFNENLAELEKHSPAEAQALLKDLNDGKFNGEHRPELTARLNGLVDHFKAQQAQAATFGQGSLNDQEKQAYKDIGAGDALQHSADPAAVAKKFGLDDKEVLKKFNADPKHDFSQLSKQEQVVMLEIRRKSAEDLSMAATQGVEHFQHMVKNHEISPEKLTAMKNMPANEKVAAFKGMMNLNSASMSPEMKDLAAQLEKLPAKEKGELIDNIIDGKDPKTITKTLNDKLNGQDTAAQRYAEIGASNNYSTVSPDAKVATKENSNLDTGTRMSVAEASIADHEHPTAGIPKTAAARSQGQGAAMTA